MILEDSFRSKDDNELVNLLKDISRGRCSDQSLNLIKTLSRQLDPAELQLDFIPKVFPLNEDLDYSNMYTLDSLPGQEVVFQAYDIGEKKFITESRPLKHVGRKKWGTQDDLRAHKGLPPFAVPFDFKLRASQRDLDSSRSRSVRDNRSN